MTTCPLCFNKDSLSVIRGPDARDYRLCNACRLIFAELQNQPSEKSEKERYLTHNNGIQHQGYVKFLKQAIEPALPFLSKGMHGLDFGCGPTPTLSIIIERMGFLCDDYDPLFFPDIPKKKYDFIFATESFEHFFLPAQEIMRITSLLKPGGLLIVMTETWKSTKAFAHWHYANDFTHVCFFHNTSFDYIAETFGFTIQTSNHKRVWLLKKTAAMTSESSLLSQRM